MLRDVTITNRGDAGGLHNVMAVPGGATMRIEDAVVEVHTSGHRGFALVARGGSSVDVRDSRLETDSRETAVAFYAIEGSSVSRPRLRARREEPGDTPVGPRRRLERRWSRPARS